MKKKRFRAKGIPSAAKSDENRTIDWGAITIKIILEKGKHNVRKAQRKKHLAI